MATKAELLQKLWDAIWAEKAFKEAHFYPPDPDVKPFAKQLDFLRSNAKNKLARCGNRAGKTLINTRDLAWRIMRKHPYIPEYYCATDEEYLKSPPKLWWFAAPDLGFLHSVVWKQYLESYIPSWYYTDDDLVPMIRYEKVNGREIIHSIRFRNGDELYFRSYTQGLLSKMGAAVSGGVYLDEPPPNMDVYVELCMRVLDSGGIISSSWTPVDVSEELVDYVENSKHIAQFRWSMLDNPAFRDNPEKLQRVLEELDGLPEPVKMMRLYGDWVYTKEESDRVFSNLYPETVDDFAVPPTWRRARVIDPATNVTGFCEFAENPHTKDWYCIYAVEIGRKGAYVKATDLEAIIDERAPYPGFTYVLSLYDGAEKWFAAHAMHKHGQWVPITYKDYEVINAHTRNAIGSGKLKFFKVGGGLAVRQLLRAKAIESKRGFKKFHCGDCIRYFCMYLPELCNMVVEDSVAKREEEIRAEMIDNFIPEYTDTKNVFSRFYRRVAR